VYLFFGAVLVLLGFFGNKDGLGARLLHKHRAVLKRTIGYPIVIMFMALAAGSFMLLTWSGTVMILTSLFHVPMVPAMLVTGAIVVLAVVLFVIRHFTEKAQDERYKERLK
jgi:hypothetical protein